MGFTAAASGFVFIFSILGGGFVTSSQVYQPPVYQVKVTSESGCIIYSCTWAELKCVSNPYLPQHVPYVWFKNGEKISEETTYSYSDYFYPKDSYSCAAKGHDHYPSPSVCVSDLSCNRVNYIVRRICAPKGSSVDISSKYKSYEDDVQAKFWFSPERSHRWQYRSSPEDLREDSKYAGRVQVFESERGRSTLRITNLRQSDTAQYGFKFKTSSFEWMSSLPGSYLDVTDLLVVVTRITVGQSYAEAELKCSNKCYPTSFVWVKNGQIIKVGSSYYKGYFYPGDIISCALKGYESYRSPSVYPPKVPSVWASPSREVMKDSSVTLTCSSDANPKAQYTWYKKNANQYPTFLSYGPQLVLGYIQPSGSGEYYCTAENDLGRRTSNSIFINVKYAPKTSSVSVSPSGEIVEGRSVTLTCSSDANPAATYTWYKKDRQLLLGPGSYRFTSISSENRGTYLCKSENQYGRLMSSSLFIDVMYGPKLPSVSVSPSGEIVEGSSVTLTCSSDANPAANYTWYKGNQTLLQGPEGIYHFSSISSEDRGIYYCKSENQYGQNIPSSLFIDVQYAPKLPSVSVNATGEIMEGSSVNLTCSSDANPAANYTWYKENQTLFQGPEGIYHFTSISSGDRGIYYCKSENHYGRNTSLSLFIDVKYAPKLPSVSVNASGEIMEGSSVNLTCSSDANPAANYTWYHDNQTLFHGPEGIYHFTSISSEDRGTYYCKSENQYGQNTSSSLFIDVQYAPKLPSVSVNASGEIMEGSSVNLTCSSDANPAANYTWYKENQTLFQGPEGIYHFTSISSEDRGIYYCKSENHYGRNTSLSLFIDVKYAPKLPSVSVNASGEIMEGSSVNLTCSSDANPAANYTWYHDNQTLFHGPEGIYHFTSISSEDRGTYNCKSENQYGQNTSSSLFIDVQYAPKLLSMSVSPSGEIMERNSVNLTCTSDANPAANYTWYKENQTLFQGPEGIYHFTSISSEDRGIYYCKSENHYGRNTSLSLFIDVKYAPKLPSVSVNASGEIMEGSSVNLTCSSDANPAANYTWYHDNQTLFHGPEGIYHFTSISSEDRGTYYCKSENQYGQNTSSSLFIDVQYAPKLLSMSVSPSGEIMERNSVNLTCTSDANPAANYTWYKENQTLFQGPGGIYHFTSISSEDRGIYYCKSENHYGRNTSLSLFIDVKYAPKLPSVSVNASGEIMEGSSVNLTCSSDANPAANYTWYHDNQTLFHGPEGIYHFTSISSEDRGTYYCKSENQYGQNTSSSLFIDVQYAPKLPSVSVNASGEIMEGSSVNLTCSSDANPAANYTWYHDNQTLFHGPEGIYHFTSISSEDRGTYYCKSENQYGQNTSSSLFIDVQYAPKLLSMSVSPSGEIMERNSVNLTCTSDANPAANYTWYKENQTLFQGPGGIYHFTSISSEDRGIYYCKSENHYGRNTSLSLFIDVKYAPKLPSVSVNASGEIMEGSSVNLTCSSDANPAANYTWYHDNQTLFHGPEGIYHFTSISSEDRGTYYCKSENQYGQNTSSSLFIDVQYAPKLLSMSVSPSGEIMERNSVNLTCTSDANPAANYTWYKENQTLFQGPEGIYHFTSISSEDRGIYYCKSENHYGRNTSLSLFIDVKYAPKLPSVLVNASGEIMEGSSVNLTCSSDANPAANYTWYHDNQTLFHGPEGIYHFTSISSEDRGTYYCKSENQYGQNTSSFLFIDVQYAPKLLSMSVSPSGEIMEGSSVTLTCRSDANPAANYTWYKENETLLEGPEGIYHFTSISSEDRGIYYCKSENHYGRNTSLSLFIDVKYAPKLLSVSLSPSGEIMEGSSVNLTCSSDANPAAKYTWYKESQTLFQGPEGIYHFMSISFEDRGIYYCKSENQYGGNTSLSLFIDVKYAPKLPSVSVSPSAEIVEGSSVTLTCSSDANPAANYTWYKENEDSPKASGQIFTVTDFRPAEHSGNYYCEAQNRKGRHNSTLYLVGTVSSAVNSVMIMNIIRLTLVVLMLIPLLLLKFWMRRKKTPLSSTAEPNDYEETIELNSVYETISDFKAVTAAPTEDTEEHEDMV